MKISLSDSAFNDLESIIASYIVEGVPDVGPRLVAEILKIIERLSDHPDSGRIVPEFRLAHIREIIKPPFRIVYLREAKSVTMIRVWRSERLMTLEADEA